MNDQRAEAPASLLYLANIRLPTEKAHGLQIMHNCEAFADAGLRVSLWAAWRVQVPVLRGLDAHAHYGVAHNFRVRRLPSFDLLNHVREGSRAARFAFSVQLLTYLISAALGLLLARAQLYYTRDERIVVLLSLLKPRARIAYEPHQLAPGRIGRRIQALALRRAGSLFPVTRGLAEDLIARGADPARILIAHDGIRGARFANMPSRAEARRLAGWPPDAFIVGYVGRLQTLAMDKGLGTLIEAAARVPGVPVALAIVGGPAAMAEAYRQDWLARGLPAEGFLYAGQVAPDAVPRYLAAFDACAMPLPDTPHFARHASPIKLFEYMSSGSPVIASDLGSFREIVADGETALLVPPADPAAWALALARLRDDAPLRERMAERARALVFADYTWAARVRRILDHIAQAQP